MSQNSLVVANGTGAAVRAALNNALDTLATNNSGASAPSTTQAYLLWADTTTGLLKIRNAANSAWIVVGTLAQTGFGIAFDAGQQLLNLGLAFSVAGNALTIALKGADGSDPSTANPVKVAFRSATLATGTPVFRSIVAAVSTVISSGSTGGATSGVPFRLYFGLIDHDASTQELIWWNSQLADGLFGVDEAALQTSTAEGGAGGADTAGVIYSTTARASKPIRVIGWGEFSLTTAGTWDEVPDKAQIMGPGVRRTGDSVRVRRTQTGAVATGTTLLPVDDTIPQNTEGDQYMAQATAPTSAINRLRIRAEAYVAAGGGASISMALFQDTTADALAAVSQGATDFGKLVLNYEMRAGTTNETTFKIRAGQNAAGTTGFNGSTGGARFFGGTMNSFVEVEEIFA